MDNNTIETISIEDILGDSFITYALATIIDRAIPENRDGLKPVQRRILYVLHNMKLYPDAEKVKVQAIAGEVMKYHPHGDASIADAIFRMGQDWIMRYPFIDPQGNFGSPDEKPAAPRYPEAGLTPYGALMLGSDLDKEITDYRDTYDGRLQEPALLPGLFPNILCNGQSGIAVAMTIETVTHNLTEVCEAIKLVAKNPDIAIPKIMKVLPGPDFPTGGYVLGTQGIIDYFTTGTGTIYIQGKADISDENGGRAKIVVTELPYNVSPSTFINDMEKLKDTKKNEDIDSVENLSDKNGMKIEITLKKGANPQIVLNNLYKHTKLRVSISVINNFIDEKGNPVTCNIKEMINSYISHRIDIILKRSKSEYDRSQKRFHIVEGLLKALDMIDETISIIKKSKNRDDARQKLIKSIKIDEIQANSILDMQLSRLTNLGVNDLTSEKKTLSDRIQELKNIIDNKDAQIQVLCSEVDKMSKELGDERRTFIIDKQPEEIKIEDLIENEKMVVVISRDGYAKRVNYDAYKTQGRGGKGVLTSEEEDDISEFFVANTHDELLLLSESGNYYRINVLDIQQSNRKGKGVNIRKIINIDDNDVIAVALIDRADDSKRKRYLTTCTKQGYVKRTDLEEYKNRRISGSSALKLSDGDTLQWATITDGYHELLLSTKQGFSVRFKESEIRNTGKVTMGVGGIKISKNDELVSFLTYDPNSNPEVLTISESGIGKRTDVSEYRITARNMKGVRSMNLDETTGSLVSIVTVSPESKLMVVTNKGKTIKVDVNTIRKSARVTKGVKIIKLDNNDKVTSMTPIVNSEI